MSEETPPETPAAEAPPKPERPPPPRAPRRSRSPLRNYLLLLITGFALVISWDVIGFFLFLLLMGGVLSYLGDQLGSYCGKQRLSLFGLRPKYTAGLINLATGLLITVLTFGGAIYVSEDVRVAVFRVRELRQQADRLRTQEATLKEDIQRVRDELSSVQASMQEATAAREAAEADRATALRQTAELANANTDLAARNSQLTTSNAELEERRKALSRNIQEKLVEIDRLNLALEKKETAPVVISRNQELLDETTAVPLDVTTEEVREVVGDIAARVGARVQLLDVKFDDRAAEYVTRFFVDKVVARLRQISDFYAAGVKEGKIQPKQVPRECHIVPVSTRNVSVGEPLSRIVFDVRPNNLIFATGEEVARTLVDGSVPPDQILDGLLYFDQQVRSVLRENGVSASVLRRGGVRSDPARLLELVKITQMAAVSGVSQVVLCKASSDVYAFGEVALTYALESQPTVDPSAGTTGDVPGGFVVPERGPPLYSLDPQELDSYGSELVLPEPNLSTERFLDVAPGLGVLPGSRGVPTPDRPGARPEGGATGAPGS